MFSRMRTTKSTESYSEQIKRLKQALEAADAVVIGAGAGLSTSAGFVYNGERFKTYFSDFEAKYGFHDMYSGGFYPYAAPEEHWAYWSRSIYINRYMDAPKAVYDMLFDLVKEKEYFVITTNVDHCFQKAGFDKKQLFYTQGDYGLLQCSKPCRPETYGNEELVRRMVEAQGFVIEADKRLTVPEGVILKTSVPGELVPHCPRCGRPMTMNLRCDDSFAEDEGWHEAAERYQLFLRRHQNMRVLFLELGVGANTPGIIKFPFWRMTAENPKAVYACVNKGEAYAPVELREQAVCVDGDLGEALCRLIGRQPRLDAADKENAHRQNVPAWS